MSKVKAFLPLFQGFLLSPSNADQHFKVSE